MINLSIDGRSVEVEPGTLVIEAAKKLGITIPVFCYHPRMKPVAACRMCLVGIEKMGKLQPACATPVAEGMVVHTQRPDVQKAQAGVLEFLLAQHPLDCPICDKGGECPLQDQSFAYGPGATRFAEPKRHLHKAWTLGPMVVLDQERCVQCQRCTRFMEEIVGDPVLVLKERGAKSVVDVADGKALTSVFSGNTIEMCPVGALTSHPYRFRARPWDIVQVSSVCPHCPVGCNLTATVRDGRVMRMLSRENEQLDQGWLCDRGRFGYGFLTAPARISSPLIRRDGQLVPCTWDEAISAARSGLEGAIGILGGGRLSLEAQYLLARFRDRTDGAVADWRVGGQHTALAPAGQGRLTDLDQAGVVLMIESDPKTETPVAWLRLRQNVAHGRHARVVAIGPRTEEGLASTEVLYRPGEGASVLEAALAGKGDPALVAAVGSEEPLVVFWNGYDPLLYEAIAKLVEGRQAKTSVLVTGADANGFGAQAMGLVPKAGELPASGLLDAAARGELDGLLVVGTDLLRVAPAGGQAAAALERTSFVVVADVVMSDTAELADVVLPLAAFAEADGVFVNMEGLSQVFEPAATTAGVSRPDWEVFAQLLGDEVTLAEVRDQALAALGSAKATQPVAQGAASQTLLRWPTLYYRGVTPEPHLDSLVPDQVVEMAAKTARALGVEDGEDVALVDGETEISVRVAVSSHVVDDCLVVGDWPGSSRLGAGATIVVRERSV